MLDMNIVTVAGRAGSWAVEGDDPVTEARKLMELLTTARTYRVGASVFITRNIVSVTFEVRHEPGSAGR